MGSLGRRVAAVVNGLSRISGAAAAICIVVAAFVVTEGVLARKLLGASTIWQIEASVFLLMFAVFVGAPFVQKGEHHLNVDLVLIHLSARTRTVLLIIVSMLTCLLAAVLAWYSWPMWWESVIENEHSESLWSPPMWIPHFFLPFGMTLLALQYVVQITERVRALVRGDIEEEVGRTEAGVFDE